MDYINLSTENTKTISAIINSAHFTSIKETELATFFRIGKKGVLVNAKKKIDKYGNLGGYDLLRVKLKPHYYFNGDLHNGNEFTSLETIEILNEIIFKLNIDKPSLLRPTSFDFGVNVIPDQFDTKDIVNNSLYFVKKPLLIQHNHLPFYKTTKAFKTHPTIGVKTYHKGIQFPDLVHPNTWRYENMFANFRKLNATFGINSFADFFTLGLYNNVSQYLLDSWNAVLILDKISSETFLHDPAYYEDRRHFRNGLRDARNEYYNVEGLLHRELKSLLKYSLAKQNGYMQIPTIIDSLNLHQKEFISKSVRRCRVTEIDISSQKKVSRYLSFAGLKELQQNQPEKYAELERKYLSEKMKSRPLTDQIYYIAHNIRNSATNEIHNRRRFVERNYHPNQMQFTF